MDERDCELYMDPAVQAMVWKELWKGNRIELIADKDGVVHAKIVFRKEVRAG